MKRLTQQAEEERALFHRSYDGYGCTCFKYPPCGHCTHPGNPANQAEDPGAWEVYWDVDEAVEAARHKMAVFIDTMHAKASKAITRQSAGFTQTQPLHRRTGCG